MTIHQITEKQEIDQEAVEKMLSDQTLDQIKA